MFEPIIAFWDSIVEFFNDYIVFPIVNINVVNILDILLLSYMIYILYKFVRDRHASRILIGIVALVGLYVLSDVLNMVAMNTILKTLYTAGIVAICVLLRYRADIPDLRTPRHPPCPLSHKGRRNQIYRNQKGAHKWHERL